LVLPKPQTCMNVSGSAVKALVRRYTRLSADLILVYDELDLPLRRIRIRKDGSHGGHHGMRDVITALGSQQFPRIRLGIGRPPSGVDPADHVLSSFKPDERPLVEAMLDDAVAALEQILREGPDSAMNVFNRERRAGEAASGREARPSSAALPRAGEA